MTAKARSPYAELGRVFHEPNRLAIVSHLCGEPDGATFVALKEACGLTDGNLSRHLKTLQTARAVRVEKAFVGAKPRTTVFLTDRGRNAFVRYLEALEAVLEQAAEKAKGQLPQEADMKAGRLRLRPSRA